MIRRRSSKAIQLHESRRPQRFRHLVDRPPVGGCHLVVERFDAVAVEEAGHENSVVRQCPTKLTEDLWESVGFVVNQGVPGENSAEGTVR